MDEALIRYKDVEIHQQELCVLNSVNLELHKGEFVYLIGKVGSGKTSVSIFRSYVVSWALSFRTSNCLQTVRYMIILSLCFAPPGGKTKGK